MQTHAAGGLLERDYEIERVTSLVEDARAGRGAAALVEGPAGIGKTRVLETASSIAAGAGLQLGFARAGLLERELGWNLVRQLFGAVVLADRERQLELLSGASALARPALGLAGGDTAGDESGLLHGLYWLTEALASEQPLLLVVDDAHWGDQPSLRYLAYMAQRLGDLPVLLLVALRSGEPQDPHLQALAARGAANRLELHELSANASATLTRRALGAEAAPEFCAACHRVTGGNPFILTELLNQLRADAVAPTAAAAPTVEHTTPETVRRSVLLRLALLPPTAQELARAVAVLGSEAHLHEATLVAGLDPEVARVAADALAGVGILTATSPLRFVHPLVRESVYSDIPAHQRSARHRRAAELLSRLRSESHRVAMQLLSCDPAADAWVVERLRESAAAALAEGASEPAVELLRRALREPPAPELRATVLGELAGAEALGGSDDAIAHLREGIRLAADKRGRVELSVGLAMLCLRHGLMVEADALAHGLIEQDLIEDPVVRMRVIAGAVTGAILLGELRPQVDYFLRQVPAAVDEGTLEGSLALTARVAEACMRRAPMPTIADLAERSLQGGWLLTELNAHELLYWNVVSALVVADRLEVARDAITAAMAAVTARGSAVGFALCSCFRAKLNHRAGDVVAGTADGWQALRSAPVDVPLVRVYTAAFLTDCLVERGEHETALALLDTAEFRRQPTVYAHQLMRASRGRALIAAGRVAAGVEELLAVGAELGESEFGPAMCSWRAYAATGLSMLGRTEQARALAEEELELAQACESAWGQVAALQALAAAAPQRAPEALEHALGIAGRHGFALEHARCQILLGAHHRRHHRRQVAAKLLRDGYDAALRCGAGALCERAEAELVGIGLRPRRRPATGVEALTPSERRVAEMAVGGLSNREIAQSLFLSLRTVETHLTHCYQKLQISSRGQLAAILDGTALG